MQCPMQCPMQWIRRHKSWLGAFAGAAAFSLGLSECGGGAESASGGDSIKAMLISQLESKTLSWGAS